MISITGRFSNLNRDITEVLVALLSSQDLCKLLYYKEKNPLSQPNIDNPSQLIYNNIYPYRYVPEIQVDVDSYITVVFGKFRNVNGYFKAGRITFNILCHHSLERINQGSRIFSIMNEIDKIFNDKDVASMFKLKFKESDELLIKPPFVGYYIEFETYDLN